MKSHLYKSKEKAEQASKELGCKGTHEHKDGKFMPCSSHKIFQNFLKKSQDSKKELDELIDFDGTFNNSKIPPLDPRTTAKGLSTMDKRVAAGHQTQDPLMRGYRVYYGESVVREEDMENAFGYEETKYMDAKDTIDYFVDELEFDKEEAKNRASEMGKDEKIPDNPEFEEKEGFIDTIRLTEKKFTKEQIVKMAEDSLVLKTDDKDLTKKELSDNSVSPIIKRNVKALKNMAQADGITVPQLIKMLKNE